MEKENIIRLAKPKKKGLLSLVFSRFFIVLILIAGQMLIYLALLKWVRDYLPHYAVIQTVFIFCMILYLVNNQMDYSAKLTWLALIAVVPVLGAVLLAYTQTNLGQRATSKRVSDLIAMSRDMIIQDPETMEQLKGDPYATDDLQRYLSRSGCFPIYRGTEARYFQSGEEMLPVLLEELEKAQKYIFLEYFIIEEGYMWGRILEVLTRKAAEGVDVRVMFDGMCELLTLPPEYPKLLEKNGIRAKSFSRVLPIVSTHYNYRDHRKILVIDGKTAFNGGVNLADEYINHVKRFGYWKDAAVMLKGSAVASFTLMFLQMWNVEEREPDFSADLLISPEQKNADGFVMPYADCPLDRDKVGERVYMDILNRATSYVHIMTPYLILDGELETALKFAAERGVDVTLILPGIPDKKTPYALAKSHYRSLLESGVKIYEFSPGFVHAKVFISDDVRAVVGTVNLDYRSLYHHFECATLLYRTECIRDMEDDFRHTVAECREVSMDSIKNGKILYSLMGGLLKILAPLM